MKKKILIFSAGPAGREINQLILNINKFRAEWKVVGFVDDDKNFITKFMTKEKKSIFNPAKASDLFDREDFVYNQKIKN